MITIQELETTIMRGLGRLGADKDAELAGEAMKGILDAVKTINVFSDTESGKIAKGIIRMELFRQNVDIFCTEEDGIYFCWEDEDE